MIRTGRDRGHDGAPPAGLVSGARNPRTEQTYQSCLDQIPPPAAPGATGSSTRFKRRVRLRTVKGGLTASDRALLRDEAVKLGLDSDDLDRLARSMMARSSRTSRGRAPARPSRSRRGSTRRAGAPGSSADPRAAP
ncbi:MAG: hypothetical protein ACM35G_09700, partial [Planctomycetaceae bacterium]